MTTLELFQIINPRPSSWRWVKRLRGRAYPRHAEYLRLAGYAPPSPEATPASALEHPTELANGDRVVLISHAAWQQRIEAPRPLAGLEDARWLLFYEPSAIDARGLLTPLADSWRAEVVLFRQPKGLLTPFEQRSPERAITFAVRPSRVAESLDRGARLSVVHLFSSVLLNAQLPDESVTVAALDEPPEPVKPTNPAVDRLTLKTFCEALALARPGQCAHLLTEIPYRPGSLPISSRAPDAHPRPGRSLIPRRTDYDVIYVTDFRIRGGGVHSVLSEIAIAVGAGLRVAALHLEAVTYESPNWAFKHDAHGHLTRLGVPLLNGLTAVSARLVVLRYPPLLAELPLACPKIATDQAVIVVNQPPKRLTHERPFYDPARCAAHAQALFGRDAAWAPNGPDAREAMHEYAQSVPLAPDDWTNVIPQVAPDGELEKRARRMDEPGRRPVIGRHVRDVYNKWPSTAEGILTAYPDDGTVACHFLGGCQRAQAMLGYQPEHWACIPFEGMAPGDFLQTLDVFVFFPHEQRIEPMARCVIEAMAAGVPTVLPRRFRGYYGATPLYCEPREVASHVAALTTDSATWLAQARATRDEAWKRFGPSAYRERLRGFGLIPTAEGEGHG